MNGEGEALFPRNGDAELPGDLVSLYFLQMAREPLLTAEGEVELARRIEAGKAARETLENSLALNPRQRAKWEAAIRDAQVAREHLARANARLVVSIAKRYMGQSLPFLDLIQEGNTGLMRAVDKYDYRRGYRFSTYAWWWICQRITRALAQKTRTIRIPLHITERIRQMYRTAQAVEQAWGRRPTPEEVSGGPTAVEAQDAAIGLAKNQGDALLFFFVADTDFLQRSVAAVRPDIVQAELESMGEFLLAVAQERAKKQSVEAEILVRSGYLRDELLTTIREENVTTVVLGTPSGQGAIFALEGLQSLAEGIADEAGVKVIIVGSENDEDQG